MKIGIILGAVLAAGLAGRFGPTARIPLRSLVAPALGGVMMGYGARIAYGCNIGAFFSGVASTSLHGWLWIAAALPGTWLGVRLRRHFIFPTDEFSRINLTKARSAPSMDAARHLKEVMK